jgi:glycosyltransferase involved in cell wall biosynthesis
VHADSHDITPSVAPLVTIVTVVFNARNKLERTIMSVIGQDYPDIEYIIIDGGSKDGTLDIVDKYKDHITFYVSEPDSGLYDAMNKGISHAHGDYLWFLNAGDLIYANDTISKIMGMGKDADVYYGNTLIIDMEGRTVGLRRLKPPDKLSWKSFRNGMVVCHQAVIVKRNIIKPFDVRYRFASDYDWVLRLLKTSRHIVNTGLILARYLKGGYSSKFVKESLMERFKIMKRNYGVVQTILYHFVIAVRFLYFYLIHGWY